MAKKFGDVVQYQMGKQTVNALVVQSNPQKDGEHLLVVYLDPSVASNSMAGSLVDKAIAKAFPAPLAGDLQYGWKELEPSEPNPTTAPATSTTQEMTSAPMSGEPSKSTDQASPVSGSPNPITSSSTFSEPSKVTNGL